MIIHLSRYQLDNFTKSSQKIHQGIAFVRQEEAFALAFVTYPESIGAGVPVVAYFVHLHTDQIHDALFEEIEFDFSRKQHTFLNHYLVIIKTQDDTGFLQFQGFQKYNGTLEGCTIELIEPSETIVLTPADKSDNSAWRKQHIAIIGVGSLGSSLALELAKSGIGNFTLVDPARLKQSELHRTVGKQHDVGRFKTRILSDEIQQKHPGINVITYEIDVEAESEAVKTACLQADVILALTDNKTSFEIINGLAILMKKPAIFAKANNSASFGYIFRFQPLIHDAACLACIGDGAFIFKGDGMHYIKNPSATQPPALTTSALYLPESTLSFDLLPFQYMLVRCIIEIITSGRIKALPDMLANPAAFIFPTGVADPIKNMHTEAYPKLWWYPVAIGRDPNCPVCKGRF